MKIYDILSLLVYPTVFTAILSIIFSLYSPIGLGALNAVESIAISIAFLSILPTVPVLYLAAKGRIDINVSSREKRTKYYLLAVPSLLVGTTIFFIASCTIMFAFSLLVLSVTFLCSIINLKSKISLHASALSADVLALIYVYGSSLWPIILIIPFICFVRYKAKAHSILQLTAGAALGIIITIFIYMIFYH